MENFACSLRNTISRISPEEFARHAYSLRNTLCNDCNGLDLWIVHQFHGRCVDGSGRRKVDHSIDISMLLHGLSDILVNREKGFTGSPVHLAHELTSECVDDTCHGWGFTLADKVEIEHALDGSWLKTVDKASCFVVEKRMFGTRAQWSAWSCETTNVVICRVWFGGS